MYTLYTCAILGVLLALVLDIRTLQNKEFSKVAVSASFGCLGGAGIGLLLAIGVIASLVPNKLVVYGPVNLVAMRSADSYSGSFLFGTGAVNSTVHYNFLIKMTDGSVTPIQLIADQLVHITEDSALHDSGTWTSTMVEADKNSPLYNWAIGLESRKYISRQDFRVPPGTVIQQFTVS